MDHFTQLNLQRYLRRALYNTEHEERYDDGERRRSVFKSKSEKRINYDEPSKFCENWLAGRTCRFGSRCWYPHGPVQKYSKNYNKASKKDLGLMPTPAQQQWMMMSTFSDENQASHQAILLGNRQNTQKKMGSVSSFSTYSDGHDELSKEAAEIFKYKLHDPTITDPQHIAHGFLEYVHEKKDELSKEAAEIFKYKSHDPIITDSQHFTQSYSDYSRGKKDEMSKESAEIFKYKSQNTTSSDSQHVTQSFCEYTNEKKDELSKEAAEILKFKFLEPNKIYKDQQACDIFITYGDCPLKNDCCFKHEIPH